MMRYCFHATSVLLTGMPNVNPRRLTAGFAMRVDPAFFDALRELCALTDQSQSEAVRTAVLDALKAAREEAGKAP